MSIEWIRDLAVTIFCLVGTVAFIVLTLLAYLLYRRANRTVDRAESILKTVDALTLHVSENIIKPLAGIAVLAKGLESVGGIIATIVRRMKGESNG